MLGTTLELYRAVVTLNGKSSNIFFEDYESFKNYAEMMCKAHSGEEGFGICSHGWCDLKVEAC